MQIKSKTKYKKKLISIVEKERIYQKYLQSIIFERKANISGGCLHLYSDSEEWEDQWDENWFFIDENIRSHAKLFSIESGSDAKGDPTVLYDPQSRTAFFKNNNYYGWLKSVALALMGDVLEDNHNIFSAHAALLNVNGNGTCIIGPSGAGKTTLSYGLLTKSNTKIVADDWFYFKFINSTVTGYRSEKNTYIRTDLSQSWKEYKDVMKYAKVDNKGRAIINLAKAVGKEKITDAADIAKFVILRREKGKEITQKVGPEEALKHLLRNDFFNPHWLQNNDWKMRVRREAYMRLLKKCDVLFLNTIEAPEESLNKILEFAE
ncbi:MAG: aldolase [Candidatus Micrarchaeota archaeon]|nr:aldolase [Candidatus Micrarchaeota archaeon]